MAIRKNTYSPVSKAHQVEDEELDLDMDNDGEEEELEEEEEEETPRGKHGLENEDEEEGFDFDYEEPLDTEDYEEEEEEEDEEEPEDMMEEEEEEEEEEIPVARKGLASRPTRVYAASEEMMVKSIQKAIEYTVSKAVEHSIDRKMGLLAQKLAQEVSKQFDRKFGVQLEQMNRTQKAIRVELDNIAKGTPAPIENRTGSVQPSQVLEKGVGGTSGSSLSPSELKDCAQLMEKAISLLQQGKPISYKTQDWHAIHNGTISRERYLQLKEEIAKFS